MNRIEDELRLALARQEPPADFVDNVLARINSEPARSGSWWSALRALFTPPRLALAGGVAVVILLAVFGYQYVTSRPEPAPIERAVQHSSPSVDPNNSEIAGTRATEPAQAAAPLRSEAVPSGAAAPHGRRHGRLRDDVAERRREGEAARDKLLLALQVASATLNEAQRLVRGD